MPINDISEEKKRNVQRWIESKCSTLDIADFYKLDRKDRRQWILRKKDLYEQYVVWCFREKNTHKVLLKDTLPKRCRFYNHFNNMFITKATNKGRCYLGIKIL